MRLFALILCLAATASAQIAFDGITASASRTVTLASDEAVVALLVSTGIGVPRQQVTEALQAAGFPGASLVAMVATQPDYSYPPQENTQISYQFSLTVPATDLKDIAEKLEKFRTGKPETIQAVRFQTYLRSSDSVVEEARQRMITQLLADARKRAASLAAASGLTLGAIQAVSDSSYSYAYVSNTWFNGSTIGSGSSDGGGPQVTFSLSVKFAVRQ